MLIRVGAHVVAVQRVEGSVSSSPQAANRGHDGPAQGSFRRQGLSVTIASRDCTRSSLPRVDSLDGAPHLSQS